LQQGGSAAHKPSSNTKSIDCAINFFGSEINEAFAVTSYSHAMALGSPEFPAS
jgi:hypothetical protein